MNRNHNGKLLLTVSALVIASLACSLPFLNRDNADSTGQPQAVSTQSGNQDMPEENQLRCARMDYPCTFADASPDRIERGIALMDLADQVFDEQGNAVAVAERLLEEDDIAEIYYDERGVWYRVQGAPPLVFLHPEIFPDDPDPELEVEQAPGSKALLRPILPEPDGPIGVNPVGQKATKQALFLNAFTWQFSSDVFESVSPMLQEYRDYSCPGCITFMGGDTNAKDLLDESTPAAGPSYDRYLDWDGYDLIHVLAHGVQFCPGKSVTSSGRPIVSGDRENFPENTAAVVEGVEVTEGNCLTTIQTGHYQREDYLLDNPRDVPGIAWAHKPDGDVWMELVTTDFFRANYPGGLDDKIIFFTSCQLFADQSLADALRGENTAVFGWTQTVFGDRGLAVAIEFFQELIQNGLRSSAAYQNTVESSSHTNHADEWFGAQLEDSISEGFDPRGREVVLLMQPIFREPLLEGSAVPVEGIAGDGDPDQLLILIQIDGIDQNQNPADFKVHLALDGSELPETFSPADQVGEYSYQAYQSLTLSFDAADRDSVELEAWADLPEGGETRHYLEEVEIAGCGWIGTAAGSQSGELKGDILFPSNSLNKANPEQLARLADGGIPGSGDDGGLGLPSISELSSLPSGAFFGSETQFPVMILAPGQESTVMLGISSVGVGDQVSFALSEDSQERFEGTFTATVEDILSQSNFTVQGEMIWHVDSFCSPAVILELADHPVPSNPAP